MTAGTFNRTYVMHENPPAGMNWMDYEARVRREWSDLLNSQAGCDERTIHKFLESHPSLVPGAYSMTGPSGHAPFPQALISEAPLAGIGRRIPDFIWLANDSGSFSPVFIEIESPRKRWFTEGGVPHHHLTEAMNQLGEWQAWLNRPENVVVFYEHFQVPDYIRRRLYFRPEFVLIYGRRAEFDERPNLTRLRAQFERQGQAVMTFDRLEPARDCSNYICVTKTAERYRALTVPATLQLGPMLADRWSLFDNVADAVGINRWITNERKAFLIDRIAYWRNWARDDEGRCSIRNTGDWE